MVWSINSNRTATGIGIGVGAVLIILFSIFPSAIGNTAREGQRRWWWRRRRRHQFQKHRPPQTARASDDAQAEDRLSQRHLIRSRDEIWDEDEDSEALRPHPADADPERLGAGRRGVGDEVIEATHA